MAPRVGRLVVLEGVEGAGKSTQLARLADRLRTAGTDVRTIQLLLGHRSLATTSTYLKVATSTVCAAKSPLDRLSLISAPLVSPDASPAHE